MDTGPLTSPQQRGPSLRLSLRIRLLIYGVVTGVITVALGFGVFGLLAPEAEAAALTAWGWPALPAAVLVVVFAAGLGALLLSRFVTRPLQDLDLAARAVARARDLTIRAPRFGDDAVGQLSGSFNEMLAHLQRADRTLRASAFRYRHLVETMTEGLAILDPRGRFLYVNERLGQLLGHTSDSLNGVPLASLILGSDQEDMFVQCGETATPRELTLRHTDGTLRMVLASPAPLLDEKGEAEGTLLVLTDLTERKRSEDERETLTEQLRQAQKMEALGRLAGGVAHDFNNLLTGLGGNIELALMDLPPEHIAVESLKEAVALVRRAATLTRQLLAMSRKQVLEPVVLDPNKVVQDLHKLLRRVIGEDLELKMMLGTPPRIFADPGQLEQVLMNLAVNARDAMPRGGTLTICTARETLDADANRNEDLAPGTYTVLEVQDNGVGIPSNLLQKIFEPFFTTKDRGKGTGLGLATVYGIVHQHKGAVEVVSTVGGGSTFRVLIPETKRAPGKRRTTTTTHAIEAHTGNETLLFVEDEESLLRAGVRSLSRLGYQVLEAADGDQAIEIAQSHHGPLDILVTDVIMPGLSGRALADKLRIRQPDLPVLFTSGYTEGILGDEGLVTQDEHFLAKPYRLSTLAHRIREILTAETPAETPEETPETT